HGAWGFPELGYMGSAWATFFARCFMGLSFALLMYRSGLTSGIVRQLGRVQFNWSQIISLWRLGVNSAMQFVFEAGAFVVAGLMAGHFGKEHLDAHGISLSLASFTYMFASGVGSAGTIRAGIYKAQKDLPGLMSACRSAISI